MNQIVKFLFRKRFVFIALLIILFLFYRNSVKTNLIEKNEQSESEWIKVYTASKNRLKLLNEFVKKNESNIDDSLSIFINKIHNNYAKIDEKECSLNFIRQEYFLNKEYLKFLEKYESDSLLKGRLEYKILIKIKSIDNYNNIVIEKYNKKTRDYNIYFSTFPNFIFAKSIGLKKKKYFNMFYGKINDDPELSRKKLPEWAIGVDTL
jgi:hypothetical protein